MTPTGTQPARQTLQAHTEPAEPAVLVTGAAGALAAVLKLRPEVIEAAVAVAMTVITESGWGALNTPARIRPADRPDDQRKPHTHRKRWPTRTPHPGGPTPVHPSGAGLLRVGGLSV